MEDQLKGCANPKCKQTFKPSTWNQRFHDVKCKRDYEKVVRKEEFKDNLSEALIDETASINKPKILLLDIETSPNLVYTWGLWNQNIGLNQIEETSKVICFSAKWLGGAKRDTEFYSIQDKPGEMVKAAWRLLDEAHAVMHYNGSSFDIPHLNREFLEAGLGPPSHYANIDLYRVIKKFKFQSRKLEHVSRQLGLEGKVQHEGFNLWRQCMSGDPKSWAKMERYNRRDVTLMEDLYELMLPWIPNLPNHRLYNPNAGCPRCGSTHVQKRGVLRTSTSLFQQYQCQKCKGWFKDTHRSLGADIKDIASC